MIMNWRREKEALVISVSGRLDTAYSSPFERSCEEWITPEDRVVVLDLEGLEYISSSGLRSLLVLAKRLKGGDGKLYLAKVRGLIHDALEISGMLSLFAVVDSVDDVLDRQE